LLILFEFCPFFQSSPFVPDISDPEEQQRMTMKNVKMPQIQCVLVVNWISMTLMEGISEKTNRGVPELKALQDDNSVQER
jgi:hypothetical protein